jgi:hypothetical protein
MKYPFQWKAFDYGTKKETPVIKRILGAMIQLGDQMFYDKFCVSHKYRGTITNNDIWDFKQACENLIRCFAYRDSSDINDKAHAESAYLALNRYVKNMPAEVRPSKKSFHKGYWLI